LVGTHIVGIADPPPEENRPEPNSQIGCVEVGAVGGAILDFDWLPFMVSRMKLPMAKWAERGKRGPTKANILLTILAVKGLIITLKENTMLA
jgi:hypothetical protein